ncbi:MAG: peptide chain release factor N(5)-glutamine methyltransferase [Chitinispirillaceae bacterium]|jgi:release factor glutamine methyltransferase
MTVIQTLQSIQKRCTPAAGEFALPEAERILEFLLNCSRSELYLSSQIEIPAEKNDTIETIIDRRLTGEPLAYILGSAYFYNGECVVTPDVLIPRPDTEILVEEVLKNERSFNDRFLEFGTGSGCIAAVLTGQNPSWKAVATDFSFPALKIARQNCQKDVPLLCCDRLSAITATNRPRFDFIVSNPPYIRSAVLPVLEKSVYAYEPLSALDGGTDGLDFFRYLAKEAPPLLIRGGRIYCEIGYDQGTDAPDIFSSHGWTDISVTNDMGNRPRVLRAIKP